MKTTLLKDRLPNEPIGAFVKRMKANTAYLAERKDDPMQEWSVPSFNEIFKNFEKQVQQWAKTALSKNDMEDYVDDVAQEVWLAVHRYRDSYKGESKISTWLYTITENCVAAQINAIHEERDMFRDTYDEETETFTNDDVVDEETLSPEEALEKKQQMLQFMGALSDLERAVATLFLDGYSYREIQDKFPDENTTKAIERIQLKSREFSSKNGI